jgi:hypothetical protein
MRSFRRRSGEAEWMDAPDVTADDFARCLADLARVNTVTLARPPTIRWLAGALAGAAPGEAFTLLDVGYGQGDMLRAVHAWARRAHLAPRLEGVDLNPRSEPAARAATDPGLRIDFRTGDVLGRSPDDPVDFVISSLVAHHMTDAGLVEFLRWMERTARRGWFVNDLHRRPVAFYGFMALSTLARWHPMVRHDGPISVARAFRRQDWVRLLDLAGIPPGSATISRRFPFRLCVGRLR